MSIIAMIIMKIFVSIFSQWHDVVAHLQPANQVYLILFLRLSALGYIV